MWERPSSRLSLRRNRRPEVVSPLALTKIRRSLGRLEDIPQGLSPRDVEGVPFVLARAGDELWAFEPLCPHRAGPLVEGQLSSRRREVVCPWHRFRYRLDDGVCATNAKVSMQTYPVSVEAGEVFVLL
jgi:nitrite reductase (NADH) small subunit